MKIDNNTITITSFREAREVAYAPVQGDYKMGSFPGSYAAELAGIPERRQDDFAAQFDNPVIADYFKLLIECQTHHKLANVDFATGQEMDHSWWGQGEYCVSRQDWEDSRPLEYLLVVRFILRSGFEAFEFEFFDDYDSITEAVKIVKKEGGLPFIIERLVDPNIFDGLVEYVASQELAKRRRKTAITAEAFITS